MTKRLNLGVIVILVFAASTSLTLASATRPINWCRTLDDGTVQCGPGVARLIDQGPSIESESGSLVTVSMTSTVSTTITSGGEIEKETITKEVGSFYTGGIINFGVAIEESYGFNSGYPNGTYVGYVGQLNGAAVFCNLGDEFIASNPDYIWQVDYKQPGTYQERDNPPTLSARLGVCRRTTAFTSPKNPNFPKIKLAILFVAQVTHNRPP